MSSRLGCDDEEKFDQMALIASRSCTGSASRACHRAFIGHLLLRRLETSNEDGSPVGASSWCLRPPSVDGAHIIFAEQAASGQLLYLVCRLSCFAHLVLPSRKQRGHSLHSGC